MKNQVRSLVVATLLGFSFATPAAAFFGEPGANTGWKPVHERASRARQSCLGAEYLPPPVTTDEPTGQWIERYRPNVVTQATTALYNPLVHGIGGWIQGTIDVALGEGEAAESIVTLEMLGAEAARFSRARGFSLAQSVCVATCIVNEMLQGDDIVHMTSLELAVADGVGDCKIFAEAMKIVAKPSGAKLGHMTSWTHAFNTIKLDGRKYFVDSTQGADECNFVPASFYGH
ncbi:MAG: hypothetical protein IT285_12845 [Bdellovibrionales bacterium]|nr:hypothetical protein [Bdellovibrionales bacterium]